jgi:predicted metal-dependent peptidase
MKDFQALISASLLRLRMKSPFFATLSLFAQFIPTQQTPTAATDGKDVFFNPDYLLSLPAAQQDGLLLHEVLHAALLHPLRRGVRDRQVWNIAADIVVNGMIIQQGVFQLPPGGLRDPKLEHLSVEEVYELLLKQDSEQMSLPNPDLLDRPPEDASSNQSQDQHQPDSTHSNETQQNNQQTSKNSQGSDRASNDLSQDENQPQANASQPASANSSASDSLSQAQKAALEAHWKNALQQAVVIARTVHQGNLPAGLERELGAVTTPQLDWRSYLWRYLVQTPTDFQGFDRRFVYQGLYLESLVGESVNVFVAVDTSSSIGQAELQAFLSEVHGILGAYPHLRCLLYYADAEVYGPYELEAQQTLPKPQGGGGTSFIPFFKAIAQEWDRQHQAVSIYLTDGYGTFPSEPPELPTLWVVPPGGLALEQFPFGEAVRLLSAN